MREIKDYILKSNFKSYKSDLKTLSGIYLLHHLPSDEIYVGQSKEIKKRWTTYATKSKATEKQPKLWNILEKSNIEDWDCYVLKEVDDISTLLDVEDEFIELYDSERSLNCSRHLREAYVVKRELSFYENHLSKSIETFRNMKIHYFTGEELYVTDLKTNVSIDVCDLKKQYTLNEIRNLKLPILNEFGKYIKDPFTYFGVKQLHKTHIQLSYFADLSNFTDLKKDIKLDDNLTLRVTWSKKQIRNDSIIVLEKI